METCSALFCNKSLHILAGCHFDLFDDVKFHFHDIDGVTSFSRIKNLRNTSKRLYNSQRFGRNSFHVMVEN